MVKSKKGLSPKVWLKTPITYYGGKQLMLRHILPLIPAHHLYCEPFMGGGAVFFGKEPSNVEVINDTSDFVVNFYSQVRSAFGNLQTLIQATLHSRSAYDDAKVIYSHGNLFTPLQRAWAFWVLCNQGWGGSIGTWSYGLEKANITRKVASRKTAFIAEYSERLNDVQIEHRDACYVIKTRDREDSFFYCDPPYVGAVQGHYSGYLERDFDALLSTLATVKGKFLLSSYSSKLLDK